MFLGWYKSNTDGEEMSKFVMRYYHHGEVRDIEAGIRFCHWHNSLGCFFMLKTNENALNGVSCDISSGNEFFVVTSTFHDR